MSSRALRSAKKKRRESIRKEILLCKKDPKYFLKRHGKIRLGSGHIVPFNTYDFQEELLVDFQDNRFNIILKARQMGISTVTAGHVVHLMNFFPGSRVVVMATKIETALVIFDMVRFMLDNLPTEIKSSYWTKDKQGKLYKEKDFFIVDNKRTVEICNGSSIVAITSRRDSTIGKTASLFIIDEAAHVENLNELWNGLAPTLSTGGKAIVLSTPYGAGGWFYETCLKAEAGESDFKLTTLHWSRHPDRDQAWFDKITSDMSPKAIATEYECDFSMSGDTLIDPSILEKIGSHVKLQSYSSEYVDGGLWVYEDPEPDKNYVIGCDVARGDATDKSAFVVMDVDTGRQVAEYCGKLKPEQLALLLEEVGENYNDALVAVEYNTYGMIVSRDLQGSQYPNLFFQTKKGDFVSTYEADMYENVLGGITTTTKSRPLMIANLEQAIRQGRFKINSTRLHVELKTFIWKNNKPQAQRGKNDDIVMAAAFALWAKKLAHGEAIDYGEINSSLLSYISVSSRKIVSRDGSTKKSVHSTNKTTQKKRQQNKVKALPLYIFR